MMPVPGEGWRHPESRAVIYGRSDIHGGAVVVRVRRALRRARPWRRDRLLSAHVEINFLWNVVFRAKPVASTEIGSLRILISGQRQSLHYVIFRSKVVECSVAVTEDFDGDGGVADKFTICLDARTGFGSFDRHKVRDRAMGAPLDIRG